ncbi:MAG: methyl-accepting chemotaxis protein [Oryzomonas sp.]|uniref:methyl-accepting chemotaxis protein n=1 Tax=Oryzomonas sp. TaxID=2855186 RepID=UPI0028494E15|nr:methyl-accepting chemotaxis protein [Oryzomonas sp.]MDR3579951.1 methyl-accepting chemotaxis protein [Oryzomonas sp.]
MNTSLSSISFKAKILLLVLTSCFILGAPTGTITLREFFNSHKSFTDSYSKSLFDDFDNHAKSQVELAMSTLQRLEERYEKGELSLDEAKTIGTDIIGNLHFGTNGYVWADTSAGIHVAGKGGVIGQNRYDQQDIKGNYMIREIIKAGMQPGGGYTNYWFPKPGSDKPLPKRAYSLYFKPFDWVIGTGNYVDDLEGMVKKASDDNLTRIKHGIYLIVGVTLLILILVSLMAVVVTKMLLRNIGAEPHDMEDIAIRVAEGDLTIRMENGRSGIYEAMRQMVEGLRQVMEKVNLSSEEVLTSASQVDSYAGNITDESNRVVSQAETVATASEEMSATSSDIANNCHQAAESSNKASTTAQSGAVIVRETVEGMNRIADKVRSSAEAVEQLGTRSEQIGVIVGTIEDIADQTNLLALNAAIEAARAGEQGRGFAVVADEVRALAERTTKATHEIGAMIKNIQNETKLAVKSMKDGVIEVEQGTVGAAKSGQALELIMEQINDVTTQINQIATAAEEQTATTREITNNIHAISETVHTSAQSSQVMSVSSSRLSQLSIELQDIVRRFSL